jgi:HSP20 family protein
MDGKMLQKYFFPFPFFEEEEERWPTASGFGSQDLSVYEDEKSVFVEASLPGLTPEEVEVTFQKGVLTISGNKKEEEEDKKRKYYRRASRMYSYRVAIPGNIDETQEPLAEFKNGIMKISFPKQKKAEPKKIPIKKG